MHIFLLFSPEQTEVHRARLSYAFSLFCAVHGHQSILMLEQAEDADLWISYCRPGIEANVRPTLQLSNLYRPRSKHVPAPPPTPFELDGKNTVLFHSPAHGEEPDWLGEIFEWVSCADEYSVRTRDSVGRIPFAESYVGRHKLDARLPYAAIAMYFLQQALRSVAPWCPGEPISPNTSVRHFIISTHDVDFLPISQATSVLRLGKNAIISFLVQRSAELALSQAGKAFLMMLGCANPLDQISCLVQGQLKRGHKASYFFLAARRHRRDANYKIEDPAVKNLLHLLERQGMEIGVHGSYMSLNRVERLGSEFARLRELGFRPKGGRQHWLRFTLDRLIAACELAGVSYDTSLGWPDCVGFRAGACFAFPPYNFQDERAATFLEIPLVLMDGALVGRRSSEDCWFNDAADLLSTSRRYGWGGISVLWHTTGFGGGQLPPGAGKVFWKLVDHRHEWNDTWLCAGDFVQAVWQRYAEVGLLPPEPPKYKLRRNSPLHHPEEQENSWNSRDDLLS